MPKLAASIRILREVLEHPDALDVLAMARQLDISEAQVRKALRELVEAGMLVKTAEPASGRLPAGKRQPSPEFQVGPDALALASLVRANFPTARIAAPVLKALGCETGETAVLNVYMPEVRGAVCVAVENTTAALHYVMEVGEVKALHAGASGKAILAFLPDNEIDAILAGTLERITGETQVDRIALRRELADIRATGCCISAGQRIPGAVGISAALTSDNGQPASLVVTTPQYRFDQGRADRLIETVKRRAGELDKLFDTYR